MGYIGQFLNVSIRIMGIERSLHHRSGENYGLFDFKSLPLPSGCPAGRIWFIISHFI